MPDIEKVIEGLEKIAEFFKARGDMAVGDGKKLLLSWMRAAEDAIALLKGEEPKPVHVTAIISNRKIGECPNCGKPINSGDYPRYCGDCGQAVKWE